MSRSPAASLHYRMAFFPAVAWFVFIIVLFTLPGSRLPSSGWLDGMHADKWVHFGLFAVLVWLLLRPFYLQPAPVQKLVWVLVPLLCLGYGVGIEFFQEAFVPLRNFDKWDMVADAAGIAAGTVLAAWKSKRVFSRRSQGFSTPGNDRSV